MSGAFYTHFELFRRSGALGYGEAQQDYRINTWL